MARLSLLAASLALALGSSGAEEPAAAPAPATSPRQQRGDAAQGPAAAHPGANPNATLKPNATLGAQGGGDVSAEWLDWGHGHEGETCCMCSYQYGGPTGSVVIYAAGDYDNRDYRDSRGAFWHCEYECEHKCGAHRGAHKFGCLDEAHLRSLSRSLGRTFGFHFHHQNRFGNLC